MYRSPSTDDGVFDCLCEAMGSIQSVDPKSVFCFVGDFNCHHSEWLGSSITDAHGVAAFDLATVADCSQLVNGPTHRAGGVLDLVLTNVRICVMCMFMVMLVGRTMRRLELH